MIISILDDGQLVKHRPNSPSETLSAAHLGHEALLHFAAAGAHGFEHFAHLSVLAEEVVDPFCTDVPEPRAMRCAPPVSIILCEAVVADLGAAYRQRHWWPAGLGVVCELHEVARWCCLKTWSCQ
jgi:hypothetical protein